MIFHRLLKRGLILGGMFAAIAMSQSANAAPFINPGWSGVTFDATINPGYNQITNIAAFVDSTTSPLGYGRYFTASPGFNEFSAQLPPPAGLAISGFAAGVLAGLPGDPSGPVIDHLVVFGKFTEAQSALDFTTLFPGVSESAMINDLLTTPGATPLPFNDVNTFTQDALRDGLYGGNGSTFSVLAFSAGTDIGSGNIIVTRPSAVPEPMTLALFSAGLVGAAALRRRKSKTA
jgi:hypothetical protein